MGGTTIIEISSGRCVKEEFNRLVKHAVFMEGNNPYNGTISTTKLHKEIVLNKKENAEILKTLKSKHCLEKYDSILYPNKRQTNYMKELNFYKEYKSIFIQSIGNQKNVIGYAVRCKNRIQGSYLNFNYTLAEAKKVAKEKSIQLGEDFEILVMNKNRVTEKYADVILQETEKTSKSKKEKKTSVYLPHYNFYFFCYVSE